MSGGKFFYKQHDIQDIINDIETILNNKRKPNEEWGFVENDYTDETFKEFETAVKALKVAHIYTQRIDWLVSGDDGEDSFHERLREELKEMK